MTQAAEKRKPKAEDQDPALTARVEAEDITTGVDQHLGSPKQSPKRKPKVRMNLGQKSQQTYLGVLVNETLCRVIRRGAYFMEMMSDRSIIGFNLIDETMDEVPMHSYEMSLDELKLCGIDGCLGIWIPDRSARGGEIWMLKRYIWSLGFMV